MTESLGLIKNYFLTNFKQPQLIQCAVNHILPPFYHHFMATIQDNPH